MDKVLKKLFEQYAKRLLTNKVRPSISEEGILTIPNKLRVEKMAQSLYKDFKEAGVPDNILKTENDIKVFHHKIAEINNENMVNQFDTLMSESTLFNPQKSADVFDLKGNKMKNPKNILGGEELIDPNSEIAKSIRLENESKKLANSMSDAEIKLRGSRPYDTDEQILQRLNKGNKEGIESMKSKLDDAEDLSEGTYSFGFKKGKEFQLNANSMGKGTLKEIIDSGELLGDDLQAAINALKNRKADGGRIGFAGGSSFKLFLKNFFKSKPKKLETVNDFVDKREFMKTIVGNSEKNKLKRMFDEILEENKKVKGFEFKNLDIDKDIRPIFDQAKDRTLNSTGGRIGYYGGGITNMIEPDLSDIGHGAEAMNARTRVMTPGSQATTSTGLSYLLGEDNDTTRVPYNEGKMVLPQPKPPADPMVELNRVYNLYTKAGPGVSQETKKYLQQDFIQKLNEAEISQEAFMTNRMQKNFKAEGGRIGYDQGGPARQNFAMGKRAFLKFLASGAAGIAGLKTGILGFGKKEIAKSVIAPAAQAANEAAPAHFLKLVAKIKSLGDDTTPKYGAQPREKVTSYKDYTLSEELDSGRTTIQRSKQSEVDYYDEMLMEDVYMSHTPGKGMADETTKGKYIPDEYVEDTSYMRTSGPQKGDILDTVDGVPDDILKEVGEAVVKKADGGRIGYKLGKKVVETVIKKAGEGKFTKNEVLLNMFQNTIKETKDANTKTRFTNFIEEIKLKPELSKDPQVWNFFTKGLPKNQKLVVYGDDTVDFWTQSDFGPHNIATSAKFQKKHPYLTKDQAVKIQNMEPEDQIFEMKKLDAIRKRTANATGGLAYMMGK